MAREIPPARLRFRFKEETVREEMVGLANAVRNRCLKAFSARKSGRWYHRKGQGASLRRGRGMTSKSTIKHRASAPGEAPAVDTGALKRSVHVSSALFSMEAFVGAARGLDYALHLEKKRGKGARPWLLPATREVMNRRGQTEATVELR